MLAGDEGGTSSSAALLAVILQEAEAFFGDTVDIGSLEAHDTLAVGADVGNSYVIAPDDQDIGLLLRLRSGGQREPKTCCKQQSRGQEYFPPVHSVTHDSTLIGCNSATSGGRRCFRSSICRVACSPVLFGRDD